MVWELIQLDFSVFRFRPQRKYLIFYGGGGRRTYVLLYEIEEVPTYTFLPTYLLPTNLLCVGGNHPRTLQFIFATSCNIVEKTFNYLFDSAVYDT